MNVLTFNTDVLRAYPYPISFDVNAPYTSVPADEAIQAVLEHISNQHLSVPLHPRHISAILEVIINKTVVTFNDHTYKQASGLPISGLLTIIFMNRLENSTLPTALHKRYVDVCCRLTTDTISNFRTTVCSASLTFLSGSPKTAEPPSSSTRKQPKSLYVNYSSANTTT